MFRKEGVVFVTSRGRGIQTAVLSKSDHSTEPDHCSNKPVNGTYAQFEKYPTSSLFMK